MGRVEAKQDKMYQSLKEIREMLRVLKEQEDDQGTLKGYKELAEKVIARGVEVRVCPSHRGTRSRIQPIRHHCQGS